MNQRDKIDEVIERIGGRFNNKIDVDRIKSGVKFEHRRASYFLAEVDQESATITVPVSAEFQTHPEYEGDELIEHAMEEISPRLEAYERRGYEIRETEWRPGHQSGSPYEQESEIPVFVAFVERQLQDLQQLDEELHWLVEQLPEK